MKTSISTAGSNFIASIVVDTGDGSGYVPRFATGLGTGAVVTVPTGTIHYAQNPGCETIQVFQVLSGLQPGYVSIYRLVGRVVYRILSNHVGRPGIDTMFFAMQTSVPYIDIPTTILDMAAGAMQSSYGLTDSQLQTALNTATPLFAVNATCLAACNLPAGPPAAAG